MGNTSTATTAPSGRTRVRIAAVVFPWLLLSVALLAGCSAATTRSPAEDPTVEPTVAPTPTPSVTPQPTPLPSFGPFSGTVTVIIRDYDFQLPTGTKEITITSGTTVVFENRDGRHHTATHGENGRKAIGGELFDWDLEDGQSASFLFEEPGMFPVTCRPHARMNITIEVI